MRVNLSWVLHERSDSAAVAAALAACERHARAGATLPPPRRATLVADDATLAAIGDARQLVTLRLGAPAYLPVALQLLDLPQREMTRLDAPEPLEPVPFFRGPAALSMPEWSGRTAVAALVVRPGRPTTYHLIASGPFDWPAERSLGLQAVERLLQAHVEQWAPQRALWPVPIEALLRDEMGR